MQSSVVTMIVTLVAGAILALLDLWLRNRDVKDPTLRWLYLGLFSWALVAAVGTSSGTTLLKSVFAPSLDSWSDRRIGAYAAYLLSPVSSILFTVAAFQLSRVREVISETQREVLRSISVVVVFALSAVSLGLLVFRNEQVLASYFDAGASVIAIGLLGAGVVYSFVKYNNIPLACIAVVTFIAILWRQIDSTRFGPPTDGGRIVLSVASNATLGALLVALAMAWGLSAASRLTIVGRPQSVSVVAFFCDLRGSTKWAEETRSNVQVSEFMNSMRDWIRRHMKGFVAEEPRTIKYLGDGYMIIWERELDPRVLDESMGFSIAVVESYSKWRNELVTSREYFDLPHGIGIGLEFGSALRLTHENGSYDYIGRSVNYAAKFQALARPDGGLVISNETWNQLRPEHKHLFGKDLALPIREGESIDVRIYLPTSDDGEDDEATSSSGA